MSGTFRPESAGTAADNTKIVLATPEATQLSLNPEGYYLGISVVFRGCLF
jgi:hypothetical protein